MSPRRPATRRLAVALGTTAVLLSLLPLGVWPVGTVHAYTTGATYVYVNDESSANAVSGYAVNADGSLSALPGSPFATGGAGNGCCFFVVDHGSMVQSANRLYVLNQASASITGFAIDPASGGLTRLPGFPTAIGFSATGGQYALTAAPGGDELFVAGQVGPAVYGRPINPDGSLGAAVTSVALGHADEMAVSPDGHWLAVGPAGGVVLMPIGVGGTLGAPVTTSSGCTTGVRFSPDSAGLITGNCGLTGTTMMSWAVNANGTLTQVSSVPTPDAQALAVSGDGTRAFGGSPNLRNVYAVTVGSGRALSGPTATVLGSYGITSLGTNTAGTLVYATNSDKLNGWSVGSGGALTSIPGATVTVPGGAGPHSVMIVDAGSIVPQAIVLGAIGSHTYGDAPFDVTASGGGSGNAVTFTAAGPCAAGSSTPVAGQNATFTATVSLTGAGTCTITANQAAGGAYGAGNTSQSFSVARATPAVNWANPADISYGTPLGAAQLDATVSVPGFGTAPAGTMSYVLADMATPAAGAVLHAGAAQTLNATFTPSDTTDFTTATGQASINVVPAAQSISFNAIPSRTFGDPPFTVSAVGGMSGLPVTFTVGGTDTCALSGATSGVNQAGDGLGGVTVTLTGAGSCTVTAHQPATADYSAAPDVPQSFVTGRATPLITWPSPAAITYGTALGSTQLDAASSVPGTFAYTYGASNTPAGGAVLPAGDTQVTATFTPADSADYTSASSAVLVTVDKAAQAIVFPAIADHTYGDAPFTVSASGGGSTSPVLFSADGGGNCSVTSTDAGTTVSIVHAGSCAITATQDGDANHLPAPAVANTLTIHRAVPQLNWSPPQPIVYGTALDATELDASTTVDGVVSYTVDGGAGPAAGQVLHAGAHTLGAGFTPTDAQDYTGATAAVGLTVLQAVPSVSWSPAGPITYGTPLSSAQLDATSPVAGSFVYAPAAGAVLHANTQSLHATFTPADTADYTAPAVAASLVVNPAPQAIGFGAVTSHTYGDAPFTVSATGGASGNPVTFAVGGTDQCALANPAAGVDGSGNGTGQVTVSLTGAGGCTLTARQQGSSDYLAAPDVPQSFSIARATPLLAWTPPADIVYGTALSSTQLDASLAGGGASGSFAYTVDGGTANAAGQVLAAGTHVLTALFTPDTASSGNYTPAGISVPITVAKAPQAIAFPSIPSHVYLDGPFSLPATGGASGNAVSYSAAGPCTVSGATATITGAGSCTITAAQQGNANYLAAPPVSQTFQVAKASLTLTFGAIANHTYGDAPFALAATGDGATTPVTFTAGPASVCSVSVSVLTLLGPGTCAVTASQAGDANYNPSPSATRSFSVAYRIAVVTDLSKAVKTGAVLPLKIEVLSSRGANVSVSTVVVHAVSVDGGAVSSPGASQQNNNFRFLSDLPGYIFNVQATGLAAGTHILAFSAGADPTLHTVQFLVTT